MDAKLIKSSPPGIAGLNSVAYSVAHLTTGQAQESTNQAKRSMLKTKAMAKNGSFRNRQVESSTLSLGSSLFRVNQEDSNLSLADLVPASHSSSIFRSFTQRLHRAHLRFARGSSGHGIKRCPLNARRERRAQLSSPLEPAASPRVVPQCPAEISARWCRCGSRAPLSTCRGR